MLFVDQKSSPYFLDPHLASFFQQANSGEPPIDTQWAMELYWFQGGAIPSISPILNFM